MKPTGWGPVAVQTREINEWERFFTPLGPMPPTTSYGEWSNVYDKDDAPPGVYRLERKDGYRAAVVVPRRHNIRFVRAQLVHRVRRVRWSWHGSERIGYDDPWRMQVVYWCGNWSSKSARIVSATQAECKTCEAKWRRAVRRRMRDVTPRADRAESTDPAYQAKAGQAFGYPAR